MWRRRSDHSGETVICIACGDSLPREEAREYDKEGDRWDRRGKEFEYLCKECHGELTHQPRSGLEETLVDVTSPGQDRKEFVERYLGALEEREAEEEP
ncbi:MAG: hypothetical protein V5A56_12350 [Halolamina sp.]